jgi:hypothetical protein
MRSAWKAVLILAGIVASTSAAKATKLQITAGRPVVDDIYINGHGPYRFLVDTGTNVNLIEAGLARSIGMQSTWRVDLASAAGKTAVQGTWEATILLDSCVAHHQPLLFSQLDGIRDVIPGVQGVLGQAFLSCFDYLLDLRGRQLLLGAEPINGMRTAFQWFNARPAVETSLGWLILDSGASRPTLFGVMPNNESSVLKTVSGLQQAGTVSGQIVRIENRTFWHGDAVAIPRVQQAEGDAAGLLPVSIFKAVYVCNSESYVIFN